MKQNVDTDMTSATKEGNSLATAHAQFFNSLYKKIDEYHTAIVGKQYNIAYMCMYRLFILVAFKFQNEERNTIIKKLKQLSPIYTVPTRAVTVQLQNERHANKVIHLFELDDIYMQIMDRLEENDMLIPKHSIKQKTNTYYGGAV